MRPEREPRAVRRPPPDLEAEQEVDFGRYTRAVLARWWLVVATVVAGILAGLLLSAGGGEVFQARRTIYLGQPLSPTGSVQIQSLATNPATASQIVRSHPLSREFRVSTTTVAGAVSRLGQNPLVAITVRGDARAETENAADTLAAAVVAEAARYADQKIAALEEQLAGQERELASIDRRLDSLQTAIADGSGLSSVERLTLMSLVGFAEQRRGQLLEDRTQTRQLLTLADEVERSRVVSGGGAVKVQARSRRSSMLVGGLIGLLAGIALALLWEPLVERRRLRPT